MKKHSDTLESCMLDIRVAICSFAERCCKKSIPGALEQFFMEFSFIDKFYQPLAEDIKRLGTGDLVTLGTKLELLISTISFRAIYFWASL